MTIRSKLERPVGVEPTTFSLATKHSTAELRPHKVYRQFLAYINDGDEEHHGWFE